MPAKKNALELAPATLSEADGVRYLHLGTVWVQGAMRVRKPHAIELEYVQRMMAWMLLRSTAELTQGHAVQLGLGAAAITRFCHRNLRMKTTAVELNESVIHACRLWFHLPADDEKLTVLHADAAVYVADAAHVLSAQVLNVDLYDHEAASPVLDDQAFYDGCFRMLDEGGVMSVNLFGRNASFARSAQRIARAFGSQAVCSLAPTKEGNTIVLAVKHPGMSQQSGAGFTFPDREVLAARAENIETRFGLPARKWLRLIRPLADAFNAATDASDSPDLPDPLS